MTMEQQVREAAARGYCHPKNSHKELDADLLDAICEEIVKMFSPAQTDRIDPIDLITPCDAPLRR